MYLVTTRPSTPARAILTQAFAKQRNKLPMTTEESEALRAYNRHRSRLRTDLYWDDEADKIALQERAHSEGAPDFGTWLRNMVARGMNQVNRTKEEWDRLEAQLAQAQSRLTQQMDIAHEQMQRAGRYERERDDAREEVMALQHRVDDLQGRPIA